MPFRPIDIPLIEKTKGDEFFKWQDETFKYLNSLTTIISEAIDYSTKSFDNYILIDCSLGNRIVTLPDANDFNGKIYRVYKIDSTANTLTVVAPSIESGPVNITQADGDRTIGTSMILHGTTRFRMVALGAFAGHGWIVLYYEDGSLEEVNPASTTADDEANI